MLVHSYQCLAHIDSFLAVELKGLDRCPANSSHSDDVERIIAPGEMFGPLLTARIEDRNKALGSRIVGLSFSLFVAIAIRIRPGQVVCCVACATDARNYVITNKRRARIRIRMKAVFTSALCPCSHQPPQGAGDCFTFRHCLLSNQSLSSPHQPIDHAAWRAWLKLRLASRLSPLHV